MDKKEMLKSIKNHLNISTNKEFAEFIGVKQSTLSMWFKRNTFDTELLFKKCEYLNPEWLLTGNGEMIKDTAKKDPQHTNQQTVLTAKPSSITVDADNKIPLMYQDAVAGFGNSEFSISEQDVKEYYVIPKFKHTKVDFMIEVRGNSMYPKYNSGDVVACCIINDSTFIQWNKPHIVATKEQGILIKRILEGNRSDTLTLKSDNKDYPPFDVPKEQIDGIAIVVGVIRLE